jgi:hypothetical protein
MGVLRDQMATELRLRGMSPVTQRMYLACVRRFAAYHHRSPEALGEPEVRAFLDHLLRDRRMREDKGGFKRATCRFSLPVLRKAWLPAGCPSRPTGGAEGRERPASGVMTTSGSNRLSSWVPRATACGFWASSTDWQCFAGAATSGEPGALLRGGDFSLGTSSGPLWIRAQFSPSYGGDIGNGFRCVR